MDVGLKLNFKLIICQYFERLQNSKRIPAVSSESKLTASTLQTASKFLKLFHNHCSPFTHSMTSFIDTHCHLDILESTPEETIIEAKQAGVQRMVTIAVDETSLDFVSSTVQEFPAVYGSVGFHPHDASKLTKSLLQKIRQLAEEQHKLIAIGETGLDYHYMNSPAEIQQQAFRKQLQLAVELKPPSYPAQPRSRNRHPEYSAGVSGTISWCGTQFHQFN